MTHNDYSIVRLSEDDNDNLTNFDCVNLNEYTHIQKRKRRSLERHSQEMNYFLQNEAFDEQVDGYNTTFLQKNDNDVIMAYMSLCTDAIKLNYQERNNGQIGYETFPSLKVARLAVHKEYQRKGYGTTLINFAVHKAFEMRDVFCGVKFITLDCLPHRLGFYEDKIGFVKNQENQNIGNGNLISLRLHIDDYMDRMLTLNYIE